MGTHFALLPGMLWRKRDPISEETSRLVLSLPQGIDREISGQKTEEVFRTFFREAKSVIRVFSPYVDPTFTSMVSECRVPVRIVTTLRKARIRSNPVLERCSMLHPVSVRYLHEKRKGSQMFQLHAKVLHAEGLGAYIGSANFTDTSLRYNLEVGIWVEEKKILDGLRKLFDHVFDHIAEPA
jgi:phosphatidylserine/phosphatidylglycerophosphate/cardiolipin synthase-like enzyme